MTQDNSSAQLVDDLRAALNWCVSNSGECLGDHPDRLKRFDALIDQTLSIALTRPQPSTSSVEAVLRKLIDAARMYEASCRLGGKDQEFASLKLDEAKSAALAALPSPEREPMREALAELVRRFDRRDWILSGDDSKALHYARAALAPPPAQSGDRT